MDFLDPKKKRAHEIRLFVGYFLMGIILLVVSIILFFQATGYDVDRKTGAIILNGIVFLDAHPESATIYLNGTEKGQTDNRLVLPEGQYDVELRRAGYRNWKHSFNLVGSTIERLVYPFLFPEKLEPKEIQSYDAQPGLAMYSPDRRWLLVQQPSTANAFTMTDLTISTNLATTVTIPNTVLVPRPGNNQLELVEWSTDNRHLVVKHLFDGGFEFVLIDRELPAQSVNLSKQFAPVAFDVIRLRDKKFDQYYLLTTSDGLLRSASLRGTTLTAVATGVLAFQSHGDNELLYVTSEGAEAGKVFVRVRSGADTYTLRDMAVSDKYLLDLARFENEWYMAVGATNDPRIYIYKEVFNDFRRDNAATVKPYTTLRLDNPAHLSFSTNTRFISVQSGSSMAVFDADTDRTFKYDTKLALAAGQKVSWMDGHRLAAVSGDKLHVFDYDGTNLQQLVGLQPQYLPYFDRDYDFLYTIAPSATVTGKFSLSKTPMRIPADL